MARLVVIPGGGEVERAMAQLDADLERAATVARALRHMTDGDIADLLQEHVLQELTIGDPRSEIVCEAIRRLLDR